MKKTISYEWDDAKRIDNLDKHGIDFADAEDFDWQTATVIEDDRHNYDETRYLALSMIGQRLHAMAYTLRGLRVRVISLRKANRKEVRKHEQQIRQA